MALIDTHLLRAPRQIAAGTVGALRAPLGLNRQGTARARQDAGYFPAGTIFHRVMSERVVGRFYGQRALMIGALNVPAFYGTFEHTAGRSSPFKRLVRTALGFEAIMLGDREEADRVLAYVHRMHSRVHGETAEAVGPHAAGTPYDAFDPELMLWTMAVMADSSEYFYELFVRPLSPAEREELWQQWIGFAELFGMPRSAAPASYAEFRGWYEGFLAGDDACLSDRARLIGAAVGFEIPFPFPEEIGKPAHDLILRGSLPDDVKRKYGLAWSRTQQAGFEVSVRLLKTQRALTPPGQRRGRNASLFKRVEAEEKRRIDAGLPTPQYS